MALESSSSLPDDLTFEDAVQRLEEIVAMLEDDPPGLENAVDAYSEGVQLAKYCLGRLNTAEIRIQELSLE